MNIQKTALVTGGSRGIGAEICRRLAKSGYYVGINYSSSSQKAEEVLSQIQSRGGSGELLRFDVADPQAVEAACADFGERRQGVHVLVNNAGVTRDGLLMRMKDADLRLTMDIDLMGSIFCTREIAKLMIRKKTGGSIIQISSVVGEMGNPGQSAYAAAKAGLIGFTKSVAKELASRQIRANVITPGYIQTEMTDALTEAQKKSILDGVPLGRMGRASDIAALVEFLASDDASYMTGQVIGVNGGLYV